MTVLENLRLGAYVKSARKKEEENLAYVYQMFPKLEQMTKRLAGNLSGGEARMLAMGRGVMSDAKFLAIDEPSLGLAPNLRADVIGTIGAINKRGITVLLVEQSTSDITNVAGRVYLLEEGSIAFEGDTATAVNDPKLREAFLGC
jgi:branched-chain amino acid transport system ATP-binding protein